MSTKQNTKPKKDSESNGKPLREKNQIKLLKNTAKIKVKMEKNLEKREKKLKKKIQKDIFNFSIIFSENSKVSKTVLITLCETFTIDSLNKLDRKVQTTKNAELINLF